MMSLLDEFTVEYNHSLIQGKEQGNARLFVDYESFMKDEKIVSFVFHVEEQVGDEVFGKKEIAVVYDMEEEKKLSLSDFFSQEELSLIHEEAIKQIESLSQNVQYRETPDGFFWQGETLELLYSPALSGAITLPLHVSFSKEQLTALTSTSESSSESVQTSSSNEESMVDKEQDPSGLDNDNSHRKMIALTFDDGPGGESSTRIMDVLERYDIPATFFVVGCNIPGREQQLARMRELGCDIGIHTYSHCNLNKASYEQVQSELQRTADLISQATNGYQPTLLRPPYGNANKQALSWIPYPVIMWSVDTRDWETRNADAVMAHIQNDVSAGDIILMHEIYSSTADAVERAVPWLLEQGYEFVSVSELIEANGGALEAGRRYFSGNNW